MKKNFLFSVFMTSLLLFAACSHSTCPTYDNSSSSDKYSGGKRSKTSSGLGMPK